MSADVGLDPVRVRRSVLDGIEAVRDSGLANMLDRHAVASLAIDMGFPESAAWLRQNRDLFARSVAHGFEVLP